MKKMVVYLFVLYFAFLAVLFAFPFILDSSSWISGKVPNGDLFIGISRNLHVFISSPQNISYYFNIGQPYTLNLNVSTDSPYVDKWWYKLEDLRHNTTVYQKVIFSPNITFNAVRWWNKITVFANDTFGLEGNSSVIFYINVNNSAPLFSNLSGDILACEGSNLEYNITAIDVDEDPLYFDISPKQLFFISPWSTPGGNIFAYTQLVSIFLNKTEVGRYPETLSVNDPSGYADMKMTNITVIEINHAPYIYPIGVYTVWDKGDDRELYVLPKIYDLEDGNDTSSGKFAFNVTLENGNQIFNTDPFGVINWTASPQYDGVYNLSMCATDSGISYIHPNISVCNDDGLPKYYCENFSVTVTDENRRPYFIYHYPFENNFTAFALDNVTFEVTTYDPDWTIPDIYWRINNITRRYTSGISTDIYNFSFDCNHLGDNLVEVEITDGLLNNTLNWSVRVDGANCPIENNTFPSGPSGGGGGGKGPAATCSERWVCMDWNDCQNLELSFKVGNITSEDRERVLNMCSILGLKGEICGYQIRDCLDLSRCGSNGTIPDVLQACYYTQYPSCYDGIRNCHDGACEVLTDCGGPCKFCPTCSDKIRNQGEEGIDCGGPCPVPCGAQPPVEKKIKINYTLILITLLILIVVLIIIIKVIQIIKIRREVKDFAWYKLK